MPVSIHLLSCVSASRIPTLSESSAYLERTSGLSPTRPLGGQGPTLRSAWAIATASYAPRDHGYRPPVSLRTARHRRQSVSSSPERHGPLYTLSTSGDRQEQRHTGSN